MCTLTSSARETYDSIFKYFKKGNRQSDAPVGIMSVSCNEFVIECYGHEHIKGACIWFNLVKRQELFSHIFSLVSGDKDELVVDVVFKESVAPPCIFCVCKARQEKKVRKQYGELVKFCKTRSGSGTKVGEKMVIMSDAFDSRGILRDKVVSLIQENSDMFNYIILSDQSSVVEGEKSILRCSVKIGSMEVIRKAVEAVFELGDGIKDVKIDTWTLDKCKSVRARLEAEAEKERARKAREEYIERQETEKAERIYAMSSEERRKYEERQHHRAVKRKQVKVKK